MSDPADRRRYQRYEIELQGQVGPAGGVLSDCVVRDYCSGGMLIEQLRGRSGEQANAFAQGQPVQLKLELLTDKGRRRVRVDAAVAWINGDYLGVSFPKSSSLIVSALQRHDRLSRAITTPALRAQHGGEARYLDQLRRVAEGSLPALLKELLLKAGDDLLDAADRGVSDRDRQQIYSDISALETLRGGDELLRSILAASLEQSQAQARREDDGELALVDPEDFERWLEASRVSNLLEQAYTPQLSTLSSRLGALREGDPQEALTVPFEPHHFTEALKDVAKEHEFGPVSRRVLFDRAAKMLQDKLGEFYQELDDTLDALGVPVAQPSKKVKVLRPSPPKAQAKPDGAESAAVKATDAGVASQGPVTHPAAYGQGTPFVIDPELFRELQAREAKRREEQAQELMAYMADVPNVTGSLASWMEQLNGLLVREAAADRNFFRNRQHPLHEIVDGLGHLQMFRRRPDLNIADDPLQQQVAELLKPVKYDNVDVRTLRAVAESLGKVTAEQSRLYQRNVERVAEASEGRDRVRRARRAVIAELNRRYAGRQVPTVMPDLLEVGWRAVLELALLNDAGDGAGYRGHLGLLDALVRELGGDAFEDTDEAIEGTQLLEGIESELCRVSFDPFRRNAVESRLRAELSHPKPYRGELLKMPALGEEDDETHPQTPPAGISESAWQHVLARCAAIKVGDHLRLLDAPEGGQDLRVAWIRSDRELFTLVDYRGLRVRDITLLDLALGLHRRRIELEAVDGRALSERAVDSMLTRMEARLTQQASHDSLTGLINRQQFHAALGRALGVPGRSADIGALLLVDVDQFRLVNDVYGYDTGDRLLVAIAQLLEQLKGAKVLAHLGSDRFGVLLPDVRMQDGEQRADGLCASVRALAFEWPGQAMNLSVSVGLVGLDAGGDGVAGLLRAADAALAQAKAAGGDRVYLYQENDPGITQAKENAQWVVRVDEALEHGQLKLRCQPIVPVRPEEGLAPHYEVLLGVRSGSSESLPIAEFIEAAENYNRMRAVDRWVVRTTMEWIDKHRQHMPALHGFAVNLSGQTASDPSFVDFVRQLFQRTRVDPAWLSFEVTETAAVADLSRTAGIIQDLKAMGCMVALDDFGSGLASYSYLKSLPVDWLKIDGAFVRKIAADQDDYAVVKSINEIGHFLGKKTIAEYVADEDILRLVREIGVDFAQGYAISRPLLMDDLLRAGDSAPEAPPVDDASQAEPVPSPVQANR